MRIRIETHEKEIMKKLLLVLGASALAMGLGACFNRGTTTKSDKTSTTSTVSTTSLAPSTTSNVSSEAVSSEEVSSEEISSEEASSQQAGALTYTCTALPDWITNDGCVIFAWVWSPSDAGSWKSAVYGEPATSLTFEVEAELTGFLLARCIAGTTQPNWEIKTDEVGRVYNQTEDITCTSGTYSYACAEWKEYK